MSLTDQQSIYFFCRRQEAYNTLKIVSTPVKLFGLIGMQLPKYNKINSFGDVWNNVYKHFATVWNSICAVVIDTILENEANPKFIPINFCIDLLAKAIYYIANFTELFCNSEEDSSQVLGV
ncbi:MAG: hypothetical protein H0U73_10265 [Tatlockia sp.]|nr:hypothetical protein [Tatlockia sp.]